MERKGKGREDYKGKEEEMRANGRERKKREGKRRENNII